MKNNKQNQKSIILITILVTFIVIGIPTFLIYNIISNSNKENGKVYTIINGEEVSKEIYNINEKVYCKNTEFTVRNIQEKTYAQDKGVNEGKKMIAVTYRIKNTSDKEQTFNRSNFEIINSNGEVKSPFLGVMTSMWDGEFLKSPTLASGGEKEGYLTYELNEEDTDYTIQYQCAIKLNFDKVYIKVK